MEILLFLLSYFIEEYFGKGFSSVFNLLKDNSFDLNKLIHNLNPEELAPIVKEFMNQTKEAPENLSEASEKLFPIKNIASSKILIMLYKYLEV